MASAGTESASADDSNAVLEDEEFEIITPLVIEMGKLSKKKLKAFKKGKGSLVNEVIEVLSEVTGSVSSETESRSIIPVVMVYEKKPRKKRRLVLPF